MCPYISNIIHNNMPVSTTNYAAIWSAVAASFAALSSFLIMRIQRRNLLESVRPEVVLTGWRREADKHENNTDMISFDAVKNIGRGSASHIVINSFEDSSNKPIYFSSTIRLPILAPNETVNTDGQISVFWKNIEPHKHGGQFLHITVKIYYWDSNGMRYKTQYQLFCTGPQTNAAASNEIAPGLSLGVRSTKVQPVWWLKLLAKCRRIPFLRSFVKNID